VFAAVLLGRTLVNVFRIDPGFSIDGVVTASFDTIDSGYSAEQMPALAERLARAVSGVPGVVSASVSKCGLIAGCSSSGAYRIEDAGEGITLYRNRVTPGYFRTVGIPLLEGRDFTSADNSRDGHVAIINQSIARRYFPGRSPIGRHLGSSALDTEIVGVVQDAHTQSLHDAPVPMVYFPISRGGDIFDVALTNLDVRVAGEARSAVSPVREVIRRTEPNLLLGDVGVMSSRLSRDVNRERIVASLAFSFGALTLLLASLGLYGVLSYGVAQRSREIGVRMALGAERITVMRSVLAQSARLTTAGVAIGLLGTAAGARYLSGMLYGVAPLDSVTFAVVCLVVAAVTLLTSYLPARRATRIDPLMALRCE
jgi:putative ABC transport system permease protein